MLDTEALLPALVRARRICAAGPQRGDQSARVVEVSHACAFGFNAPTTVKFCLQRVLPGLWVSASGKGLCKQSRPSTTTFDFASSSVMKLRYCISLLWMSGRRRNADHDSGLAYRACHYSVMPCPSGDTAVTSGTLSGSSMAATSSVVSVALLRRRA